jgi:hypothetical protein
MGKFKQLVAEIIGDGKLFEEGRHISRKAPAEGLAQTRTPEENRASMIEPRREGSDVTPARKRPSKSP